MGYGFSPHLFPAMHTRTPPVITKQLLNLAANLARGQTPIYLQVQSETDAKANECFQNVQSKIRRENGSIVYGWQLWEWQHILVEAEFHAVWRSPTGELTEITPKQDNEERILFLPDPVRVYHGVTVDNVRVPLRDDALIHHYITVSKEITKVMNRGKKANLEGYVSVPAHEIEPLLEMKGLVQSMLVKGLRAHDSCLCQSGKKYKRCHGRFFTGQ